MFRCARFKIDVEYDKAGNGPIIAVETAAGARAHRIHRRRRTRAIQATGSDPPPMAKILQLPLEANPNGSETVVMVKNNITRRAALGGLAGAAAAPHVATVQLTRDQVVDMIEVQRIFVDLPMAEAEAATGEGQLFKVVNSAAGIAEVRRRSATGSDSLYQEPTSAALASTAPGQGSAMLGDKSPLTNATARTMRDRSAESRSVLEWFLDEERAAARAGDLSVDHTASIQKALNSGAPVIEMHDYGYRVDGQLELPNAGIRITGKGWSIQRGVGVINNGDKLFNSVGATGPIEFEDGTLIGNVVYHSTGYDTFAAGIYVENSTGGVVTRNMDISGFAEACYGRYVDRWKVLGGSHFHGNILTGISGFINNFEFDGSASTANGFATSGGLTHDIYIVNGSSGIIRNSTVGNHLDPLSSAIALRYGQEAEVEGFDSCANWEVYGVTHLGGNGTRISSDPTIPIGERKPPENILIHDNDFRGADLWVDDPKSCHSWGNENIGKLIVRVSSSYPGFLEDLSFTSTDDACSQVQNSVVSAHWSTDPGKKIVFRRTRVSSSPAFVNEPTLGGRPLCRVENPVLPLGNTPFDSGSNATFLGRYRQGYVDVVAPAGSLSRLHQTPVQWSVLEGGETYDFDAALLVASDAAHQLQLTGALASVGTMTGAEGQMAEFRLNAQHVGNAVLIFPTNTRFSTATASVLSTGGLAGQRLALVMRFEDGLWREQCCSGWV